MLPTDPNRPRMPTAEDQARSEHSFARLGILLEEWEDVLRAWLVDQLGADRADVVGVVDTSVATINDLCRQLSTPGLYGKPPRWSNPKGGEELWGYEGLAARAGWYALMPWVQYLTLGLGDMFLDWSVDLERKGLHLRIVYPHNVYREPDPLDESRVAALWELRAAPDGYRWHVYSAEGTRVYRAYGPLDLPGTLTAPRDHLGEEIEAERRDPLVGLDGFAELPLVRYSDAETKSPWNAYHRRGAHRGTLNAALYWTYAGYCARDATAPWVAAWGLAPAENKIQTNAHGAQIRTKLIVPGMVSYHDLAPGFTGQPGIQQIGAGDQLAATLDFAERYEMKQAVRYGLNPSDLSRSAANPASAAALMVSNEGKREFSAQVTPVFRAADQQSARVAAIVARQAGFGSYPETGWSISYVPIPLSAAERAAIREDLDWQAQHGIIGPVERYRRLNPTVDDAGAIAALVAVAREQRRLDDALAAAGLGAEVAGATGGGEDVQAAAMSGGQIDSLLKIASAVAAGQLPLEAGKVAASVAFPSVPETLLANLFAALDGFVAPAAPAVAGAAGEEVDDQADQADQADDEEVDEEIDEDVDEEDDEENPPT